MTDASPTIYILYNAKASLFGKLSYASKKLSGPKDENVCAACDLTHGGLRLKESDEWVATKQQIPAQVKQLHKDELTTELSEFISSQQLTYPMVLGQNSTSGSTPQVLLATEDLNRVSKDHSDFLTLLSERAREKGVDLLKK